MRRPVFAALLALVLLTMPVHAQLFPTTPAADPKPTAPTFGSDWLDGPHQDWNTAGMDIPTPPPGGGVDPTCEAKIRPPETAEDNALIAAGWRLGQPYQAAWGVKVVQGMASTAGMCRPAQYNFFVFADGVFIGTVSPILMNSTSGTPGIISSFNADSVFVDFFRYRSGDPLCCPSGEKKLLIFRIDRTASPPTLRLG